MINGNKDVMNFIIEFYNRCGENTNADKESIRNQFMIGYCYYFAHILKGVFNKYPSSECDSLIPEDRITPYMKSFKHVPSDPYTKTDHDWFVEFCKANNIEN